MDYWMLKLMIIKLAIYFVSEDSINKTRPSENGNV